MPFILYDDDTFELLSWKEFPSLQAAMDYAFEHWPDGVNWVAARQDRWAILYAMSAA